MNLNQFDVNKIRQDFPILSRQVKNHPLAYLDNAATTQKPVQVLEATQDFFRKNNANIHRGIHTLAEEATEAYESARKRVADFIGARSEEIVFVRNATEAINLIAFSWGRKFLHEGDTIVLTQMEHHANLIPWQILSQEKNLKLEFIRLTSEGYLDLDHYQELLSMKPKLVSVVHVSNVLGTVNPVERIAKEAKKRDIPILVDCAQSAAHLSLDVRQIPVDFLTFTGHKVYGPTGIGVLWAKAEWLKKMPPFLGGGEMIDEVYWDSFTTNEIAYKFEAGTPHIAGAIGLARSLDYIESLGRENIRQYEMELTDYALSKLSQVESLLILGPRKVSDRGALVSFSIEGLHPHDLATILDLEGVAVRSGHHCAQPLHRELGLTASTRASFALYNKKEEIDRLIAGLDKACELLLMKE